MTLVRPESDPQALVGHVVLIGDDRMGARVLQELCDVGVEVLVVCEQESNPLAEAARAAGVSLVIGIPHEQATLERVHAGSASACGLLCATDLENLNVALGLKQMAADARLVLRVDDVDFESAVRELVDDVTVLSPARLAAQSFVQAVLSERTPFVLTVGERRLAVLEVDADDPRLQLALVAAGADSDNEVFPTGAPRVVGIVDQGRVAHSAPSQDQGALDLRIATRQASLADAGARVAHAWSTSTRFLSGVLDRRLAMVAALLLVVTAGATAAFSALLDLDPFQSLYFVTVTVTTTGYGDITLADESALAKLLGMSLMAFGVVVLSLIVALVADAVLGARLSLALGYGALPRSGHVVVWGAGHASVHILGMLTEAGLPCVAVEPDETLAPAYLRTNKIPLVIGDLTESTTIGRVRLETAHALISMTNDDRTNILCAMQVRTRAPGLRVVLRMFDPALALRVERATGYVSRSVVSLAAPAFVTALLGHRAAATLPIGSDAIRMVWMRTSRPIDVGSVEEGCEARILAVDLPDFPRRGELIPPGTEVLVVCTRRGLAQVEPRLRDLDGPAAGRHQDRHQ